MGPKAIGSLTGGSGQCQRWSTLSQRSIVNGQQSGSLTCGANSMVNIDQSTVNMVGSQTGFGLGRSGSGQAKHVACCGAAMSRPWALIGLRPQHGSHRVAHGGPALLVHGPKVGSMVDRAHRHFSSARLMCTGCRAALLTLPLLLCFFHGALPPATCSPASSRNGSGIQLRWGKASPCHGNYDGGVRATDGAS